MREENLLLDWIALKGMINRMTKNKLCELHVIKNIKRNNKRAMEHKMINLNLRNIINNKSQILPKTLQFQQIYIKKKQKAIENFLS